MSNRTPRIDRIDQNLIINGGMDYCQRIATGSDTLDGTPTYYYDRFLSSISGTYNTDPDIERVEDSPNAKTKYAIRYFGMDAAASTDSITTTQRIESIFARKAANEKLSCGIWVKSAEHQAVDIEIRIPSVEDDFSSTSLISSTTVVITPDSTWQQVKLENVSMPSTAARGIEIRYILKNVDNTGVTFEARLAQAKVNIGDQLQEFSYAGRDLTEELRLCRRYYEKSYDHDTAIATITRDNCIWVVGINGGTVENTFFMYEQKRAVPSVTPYSTETGNSGVWDTSGSGDRTANPVELGLQRGRMDNQGSFNVSWRGHFTADSEL